MQNNMKEDNAVIINERLGPNFGRMSIWAYSIGIAVGWIVDITT